MAAESADSKVARVKAELAAKEREALEAIKEDLCEWLSTILELKINAQTFLQVLESGVILCRLALLVQQSAKTATDSGRKLDFKIPPDSIRYNPKADPGSFHARDNASNFIDWCRKLGVEEAVIFESEGLVLHKDEKRVILCLLDVARFADKVGISPPQLVKFEREFESLDKQSTSSETELEGERERGETEGEGQEEGKGERGEGAGDGEEVGSNGAEKLSDTEILTPPPSKRPRSEEGCRKVSKEKRSTKTKKEVVDEKVLHRLHQCSCKEKLEVKSCGHGKFVITKAGKKMTLYARLLSDRVMVRVGGGWDILDHFLLKHDPCRVHTMSVAKSSPNSKKDSSTTLTRSGQRSSHDMPAVPKESTTLGKHKRERED